MAVRSLCLGIMMAILWCGTAPAQVFAAKQDWIASWVFQGQTEAEFEKQLHFDYSMRVKTIDRLCKLKDEQRSKLNLAGAADVTRFFRNVAKTRKKIDALDLQGNQRDEINQVWEIVSPLQMKVNNGLFADESLFQSVMRSVLSEEQQELYAAEIQRNQDRRRRVLTRVNVAEMERSMPLLAHQREKLLELLDLQELPKTMTRHTEGYAGFLKLVKLKKADEQALSELLDENQIKVVDQFCERYQGWVGN
jgi:hypothetical protein